MLGDKKGSASIFLVFILAAMIGLVMILIYAAGNSAVKSYSDSLLNLSGRAILSEFDLDLKKEYGIFAFYGHESDIEEKLEGYITYAIEDNEYVKLKSIDARTGEYSLLNTQVFQEQITEYTKYALAKGLPEKQLNGKKERSSNVEIVKSSRVLRNETVISSLPTQLLGHNKRSLGEIIESIKNNFSSAKDFLKTGADATLTNEYIFMHFKHLLNQDVGGETFFQNEVEYILEGEYEDDKNRKKIRDDIIAVRTAVNLAFIYADTKMRTEVIVLSEVLTPGPGALLTQAAIAGTWAFVEAENDMALLEHGKKVPHVKTRKNWAVDLDSAWKGTVKGYIDTGGDTGFDYEDYLKIFLYFQDKPTKLARMMDLIQINMKGKYNKNFLIREYNCGFQLKAEINGTEYVYEEKY